MISIQTIKLLFCGHINHEPWMSSIWIGVICFRLWVFGMMVIALLIIFLGFFTDN